MQLGEGVVRHALPSLGGRPEVWYDGDGVLYVGHGGVGGRLAGHVRYDMFWTEVTTRGTDGTHVKVLV